MQGHWNSVRGYKFEHLPYCRTGNQTILALAQCFMSYIRARKNICAVFGFKLIWWGTDVIPQLVPIVPKVSESAQLQNASRCKH